MRANPRVDASAVTLLQVNLVDREQNLRRLQRELRDVQLSNLPPLSENTRVIAVDVMPSRPVKPKKTLNVVIGAAVSLYVGVFLAFFLEYWTRITRERGEGTRPAVT